MSKATFPAQSQTVAESVKPADSDGFTPSDHRNIHSAVYQGDLAVLRPRAKSPAALAVNVAPAEIEGFFRNIYWNATHVKFAGGDSPNFPAPASNPRIDLLVLDVSGGPTGTLTRVAGTEAASPSEPALPDLKTNIPLCYVYTRVGQTKIVNFEDSGANPTEGYLYRDVRPWVPPGGGVSFGVAPGNSAIGDMAVEGSNSAAARADHRHGRESSGTPVTQAFSDSAAAGSAATISRSDHRHGMPAKPDGGYTNMQVFTANGTWTRPAGVNKVLVEVWAGGGGGGGGGSNSTAGGGGGGGGGAGAHGADIVTVTGDVSVTIGAGGSAGSAGSNGSDGGSSSFGSSVSTNGGAGGIKGNNGSQEAGGPGGDGADGGTSSATNNMTGGPGAPGGSGSYGAAGSGSTRGAGGSGGNGGVAPAGGGGGRAGVGGSAGISGGSGSGGGSGNAGVAPGSGGGGGGGAGGGGSNSGGGGGAGAAGRVVVYWNQ